MTTPSTPSSSYFSRTNSALAAAERDSADKSRVIAMEEIARNLAHIADALVKIEAKLK